jgi:hypothetical protein
MRGNDKHAPGEHGHGKHGPDDEHGPDGPFGRPEEADDDIGRPASPGRSEWSPGHLKKDAGADSARDYAPGHARSRR